MSRTGGTCGALTGAVMGVSMSLGRASAGEPVQPAYTATQRLVEEFEREFGSRDCPTLLSGCDLNTAAGQEQFREQNLAQRCMRYSGTAAEIAVRVIADSKDSSSSWEEGDEEQSCGCACC
jgi:C_GCAxxG_C_C family probable redox protein